MPVTIYHNPQCSNSRRCLEIIRDAGIEPHIVEYLKAPPGAGELKSLLAQMDARVRDIIRIKEPVYIELGLDAANDATLIDAISTHPILLNRPVVVTEKGARLCRPPELVRDLL